MGKINQKIGIILERKINLLRDSRHTELYHMAIIDYHEYICSSKHLTRILQEIITEDKVPPAYLKEIFNDFIIFKYIKYDVPKNPIYPNFYTKKIEKKYKLMKSFTELIKSERDASKVPNKINFNPKIPIVNLERDEEFFYTQRLHNDIIEKLDEYHEKQVKEKSEKYNLGFDNEKRLLCFMNENIIISKKEESDTHKLMRTLFSDTSKVWANDEILDDWDYFCNEEVSKNKVYQAGKAVNRIIAQETKIKDFIIVTTKNVFINKEYLKP